MSSTSNNLEVPPSAFEIPGSFSTFKILPRKDEVSEKNFPRNVHNACQLFVMTRNMGAAKLLKKCTEAAIENLKEGPDGKSQISIGFPSICFNCGHLGIPLKVFLPSGEVYYQSSLRAPEADSVFVCRGCGEDDQCNLVEGRQPDNSAVAWIEKTGVVDEKLVPAAKGIE